jgi:hypothetical protein
LTWEFFEDYTIAQTTGNVFKNVYFENITSAQTQRSEGTRQNSSHCCESRMPSSA